MTLFSQKWPQCQFLLFNFFFAWSTRAVSFSSSETITSSTRTDRLKERERRGEERKKKSSGFASRSSATSAVKNILQTKEEPAGETACFLALFLSFSRSLSHTPQQTPLSQRGEHLPKKRTETTAEWTGNKKRDTLNEAPQMRGMCVIIRFVAFPFFRCPHLIQRSI